MEARVRESMKMVQSLRVSFSSSLIISLRLFAEAFQLIFLYGSPLTYSLME